MVGDCCLWCLRNVKIIFGLYRPGQPPEAKGDYIMLRKFTIEDGQEPTEAQLAEVKAAAKRPVQFDEDAPELSPALYKALNVPPGSATEEIKTLKKNKAAFLNGAALLFISKNI